MIMKMKVQLNLYPTTQDDMFNTGPFKRSTIFMDWTIMKEDGMVTEDDKIGGTQ